MRVDIESTICAIATGAEGAFRGAIRVTGPDSVAIVSKTFSQDSDSRWQVSRATRLQQSIDLPTLGPIDVDFFVWPDGRSYTGQQSVELHCLGNTVILQSIQSRLIENGAVLAQPGEFTLRAFLAGRLDLTQCEAVLGVIHAANYRSLNVALSQLAGGLSEPLSQLKSSLVNLLADIEAGLADLTATIRHHSIRSIAIPPLGCGHGGLNWNDVRPLIVAALDHVDGVEVLLYAPQGAPDAKGMPNRTERSQGSLRM